jgi:23S rRNA-/tRNA-specific pseudouridylate synthase
MPDSESHPVVLHDAGEWLVLNKPRGWHSVGASKVRRKPIDRPTHDGAPDVESWLTASFEWARGVPEAGIVHRLDQSTSGCLMVARSREVQLAWREAFQSGEGVEKIYLAQVAPGIDERGEFELYFSSRHKRSKKISVATTGRANHRGRCAWRVVERQDDHDLVEVSLIGPGRRHQIRAGLAFLGHPIINDELYGGAASSKPGIFGLHAWKLVIGGIEVVAPVAEAPK